MSKIILFISIFLLITNCNLKQNIEHHGVHMLEEKVKKLIINEDNKNDVIRVLGPPSVESNFDNDLMFFIERKILVSGLTRLGKRKILANNVLIAEVDNRGILIKKDFIDLNQMNDLDISKRITEDYIKSFRSPHRVPGDCGICSLNFLNVLPIEILQDVIDEIGCDGLNSSEVKRYFDQAYGSEHNFIWQPSELLVDSNLNYKIEYIKSWLVTEVSKISPGYVMLVDLKRRTQGGHFVVLGKDLNGEMVLFDPTYGLGIYMGISNIISYLIKEKAFFLLILHSDIIEDRTEINPRFSSIPSNTGANTMLNYNCRLRHIQESRMQTEKYYDQLLLRLMNEQRERESRYLQEQQQYQMEIND